MQVLGGAAGIGGTAGVVIKALEYLQQRSISQEGLQIAKTRSRTDEFEAITKVLQVEVASLSAQQKRAWERVEKLERENERLKDDLQSKQIHADNLLGQFTALEANYRELLAEFGIEGTNLIGSHREHIRTRIEEWAQAREVLAQRCEQLEQTCQALRQEIEVLRSELGKDFLRRDLQEGHCPVVDNSSDAECPLIKNTIGEK